MLAHSLSFTSFGMKKSTAYTSPDSTVVYTNLPYSDMSAPVQGPTHPRKGRTMLRAMYNSVAGNVEGEYVDDTWFQQQYHHFYTNGTAMDPASSRIIVGDKEKAKNSKSIFFLVIILYLLTFCCCCLN